MTVRKDYKIVQPGDPLRADDHNELATGLTRLDRMVLGPGLEVRDHASGRIMKVDLPPRWEYFKPTACPDQCGYYIGDIVTWDGIVETTLLSNEFGVAANLPLTLGRRYPARLTPVVGTPTTTTTTTQPGTTTTTSSTTTTTTTSLPRCSTTTTTTTTSSGPTTSTTTSTTTSCGILSFVWLAENDYPDPAACAFSNPTGNTSLPPVCTGRCEWQWSTTTLLWTPTCFSCSVGCNCPPPNYCGTFNNECTTTFCYSIAVSQAPTCCGQTTTTTTGTGTTTTTTSTTTTQPPGCTQGCNWQFSMTLGTWVQTSNGCSPSCPCPSPTITATSDCQTTTTGCQTTTTTNTTPPPGCGGQCEWFLTSGNIWQLVYFGCAGAVSCGCQPPSDSNNQCDTIAWTPCFAPTTTTSTGTTTTGTGTTSTTQTTSTTCGTTTTCPPSAFGCCGTCYFGCDGTNWYLKNSTCPSPSDIPIPCGCVFSPPIPCTNTCQTYQTPCASPTTTTTSSSTTSTTTTCGTCTWQGSGTSPCFWTQTANNCTGSCVCGSPIFGCVGTQLAQTQCSATTTTTTTTGNCGQCQVTYSWYTNSQCAILRCPTPLGQGCCVPSSYSGSCSGNCLCVGPSCLQPGGINNPCVVNGGGNALTVYCAGTTSTPPCFGLDTPILLDDGRTLRLGDIEIDTPLKSFDMSGRVMTSRVKAIVDGENDLYELVAGGQRVEVTRNHRFMVGAGEFAPQNSIPIGGIIYQYSPDGLVPVKIESRKLIGLRKVRSLEMTGGPPTYFAAGFAVHNPGS